MRVLGKCPAFGHAEQCGLKAVLPLPNQAPLRDHFMGFDSRIPGHRNGKILPLHFGLRYIYTHSQGPPHSSILAYCQTI